MGCSASSALRNQERAKLPCAQPPAKARLALLGNRKVKDEPVDQNDVFANQVHLAFDLETPDHLDECKDVVIDDERIQEMIADLKPGELFCDPDFPADKSILNFTDEREITWVRPKDLVEKPVLLLDEISRHDIVQGNLGSCWFLASCAAVARRNDIMERVIPPNQELYGPGHNGLVQFRFWKFGKWVNVHIDDRLPVDEDKDLVYARCTDPREFWVALLEKAYAKFHGSYTSIEGGFATNGLVNLTGGLAKEYDLCDSKQRQKTFRHLLRASQADAFITCSIHDWKPWFSRTIGLLARHIYTLSSVAEIQLKNGTKEKLVRVRNPWGDSLEWAGKWRDKSKAWNTVDDETKAKLNYVQKDDGEFWMSFEDFCRRFDDVQICTLGPDFDQDGIDDKANQVKAILGCWQLGKSCGGCKTNLEKFATNPQYLLVVNSSAFNQDTTVSGHESMPDPTRDSPPDSDTSSASSTCSIIISLMHERLQLEKDLIGFVLYKTEDPSRRMTLEDFQNNDPYGYSNDHTYVYDREIVENFELEAGSYVIVPTTFDPDCPGNLMIRVYAVNTFEIRELTT